MRESDRLNRLATVAAMVAVAAFAAVISYSHIYDLGLRYGGSVLTARLLPLCVDGMILAASLVMLADARAKRRYHWLTWAGLTVGVGATVAANIGYGLHYGPVGAILWAVPPLMFVIAVEITMTRVKRTPDAPRTQSDAAGLTLVPEMEVPSIRALMREHRVGRPKAQEMRAELLASRVA